MRKLTVGTKLITGAAGLIALTLAVSYLGISGLGQVKALLDDAVDKSGKKLELAGLANAYQSDMIAAGRGVLLYSYAKNPAKIDEMQKTFQEKAAKIDQLLEQVRPLLASEEGKRLYEAMKGYNTKWIAEQQEVNRLVAAGRNDTALEYALTHTVPLFTDFDKATTDFVALQVDVLNRDKRTAGESYTRILWTALGLVGLAVLFGGGVLLVVRQVNKALRQAAAELTDGADQVASAATQVSAASQSLAQGASEQAASIEETSASSEEITSMTRKNAENSRTAAEVMGQVDNKVGEANHTLELMVESMREINTSSDKISKIIKVIDEIAFQTNILALNAAVEAARAGEAGMGFAVVADEVRNLAQRSAQAAKDTAALIEESISKSSEGSAKLDHVTKAISGITESATKVKTLVDEVSVGSQEQARGMEQIAKAITQMEQVTQKSAANAEESAAASEEMASQAETMKSVVDRLQAMVGGGAHGDTFPARGPRPKAVADSSPAWAKRPAAPPKKTGQPTRAETPVTAGAKAFPLDEEFKEF